MTLQNEDLNINFSIVEHLALEYKQLVLQNSADKCRFIRQLFLIYIPR